MTHKVPESHRNKKGVIYMQSWNNVHELYIYAQVPELPQSHCGLLWLPGGHIVFVTIYKNGEFSQLDSATGCLVTYIVVYKFDVKFFF